MSEQASFTLRNRNPDVLTCIANLSNDEVFTPPELANQMLDSLTQAWAEDNDGANLWEDKNVKFLDPCAKSGVFLREITARLTAGLESKIPNLDNRVEHILSKQVFGIAITKLTGLLTRRSLYCSKDAESEHSIAQSLKSEDGNIWFKPINHSWDGKKCKFCGAPKVIFDRESSLENHAYKFIHSSNIKREITEVFGENMQFDVIIGNPPYQITGGGGGFDSPIYNLFVDQAKNLDARYICMVTPSRWLAGGSKLDQFRKELLGESKLRELVDFPMSSEVFPGVEIKGGVSYFLWDATYNGNVNLTTVRGEQVVSASRILNEFDVFVRDIQAVNILKKVLFFKEKSIAEILTNVEPFKWASNFSDYSKQRISNEIPLYLTQKGKRSIGYVNEKKVEKNNNLIATWKVLVPKAGSGGGMIPDSVLGKPWIAPSPSVCSGSFMFFYVETESEAKSVQSYYATKFFRFIVSLRKITQDAIRSTYTWVPTQAWDKDWTDPELYKKYNLTDQEIDYIESVIRPMDLPNK